MSAGQEALDPKKTDVCILQVRGQLLRLFQVEVGLAASGADPLSPKPGTFSLRLCGSEGLGRSAAEGPTVRIPEWHRMAAALGLKHV